jgi:hypothetical protein
MSEPATNPQGEAGMPGAPEGVADDDSQVSDLELASHEPHGDDPPDEDNPAAEHDGEEIEHEGRKYRVPKTLKYAFLRQADYTRKTQELALQRRAFEQEAAQSRAADAAELQDYARLTAISDQIAAYDQIDWRTLEAQDPLQAQSLWRERTQLIEARAGLADHVDHRRQVQAFEAQRDAAKRLEDGHRELSRDIQGWSPDLASKLSDFGQKEFGFSADEIGGVLDPRMVKVLHLAYLGRQSQKAQAAARKAEASQSAQPIRQVGSQASARRPSTTEPASDRLSTDDWFRAEQERLRRRSGK